MAATGRNLFFLLVIVLPSTCCGAAAVLSVSLPTNDLVYDPISDTIYASVPSSAGVPRGNSITPINPHTGALGTSVFVSSEPTILALADDGSRLYVASESTNSVTPFSLSTMTPGAPFVIGGGDRRVDDMEVAPGNAAGLAVSKRVVGQSPRGSGIAIFVDGIQLPYATTDSAINNAIEFGANSNVLYGHANEISDRDFNSFATVMSPIGGVVDNVIHAKNLLTRSGLDMEFDNGRMYFTNGQVLDPTVPAPIGSFAGADGPVEPDSATGRTFFVVGSKLKAYSQTNFLQVGEMTIPSASGSARNLISLGSVGLALATSTGKVIIIHGIPGDYDQNGTVGLSDYDLWKANFGSNMNVADGNDNGIVDAADYVVWRENLGVTLGGTFSGIGLSQSTAPEPSTLLLIVGTIAAMSTTRRRLAYRDRA
jgi:hypothetical protein